MQHNQSNAPEFANQCPACSSESFSWLGAEPAELREVEALLAEEESKRGPGAQALIILGGIAFMFFAVPMAGIAAFLLPLALVVFVQMTSRDSKKVREYEGRIDAIRENMRGYATSWRCSRCGHQWRMQRPAAVKAHRPGLGSDDGFRLRPLPPD